MKTKTPHVRISLGLVATVIAMAAEGCAGVNGNPEYAPTTSLTQARLTNKTLPEPRGAAVAHEDDVIGAATTLTDEQIAGLAMSVNRATADVAQLGAERATMPR